jgi:lysozyme
MVARVAVLVAAIAVGVVLIGQTVLAAARPSAHGRPSTLAGPVRSPVPTPGLDAAATSDPSTRAPQAKPRPTRVPAPTSAAEINPGRLFGIDVSSHQGAIDWPAVAGAGTRFAFVRASAGAETNDPTYPANTWAARAEGLVVGSYHFAYPDRSAHDAEEEAAWFLANATIAPGDLLPVLDLERSGGLDPEALAVWAQTWLTEVESATGVRPIIYTNPSFWNRAVANIDWFARHSYPMWIAHWTEDEPSLPANGWAGQGWQFWQYTSYGSMPGVRTRVDFDWFNGPAIPPSLLVP